MSEAEAVIFKYTPLPPVAGDAEAAAMLASLRSLRVGVEGPGDTVGCYTLREKIGDGGFGSVWRAEQHEPVRREVALKIIKAGMDTLEVMARFEQERATLALMDHPNIAKVLEVGATAEGRPFFAMELVRGMPVTEYVLARALPLEQRLRLFQDICAGVQHAHQKGIIHRDLKPSNILVAEIDGAPVPKIIDFGIAKALTGGLLGGNTLHTRVEQMIGTPIYMSPEQAAGSLDVDTRSDVFALGVLLYELLAGKPPFDSRTLMAGGYDEMRRIIREVEPLPPSRRKAGDTSIVNAAGGKEEAVMTTGLLSTTFPRPLKDLDFITLRALRKERSRRYVSATALSEDIQRFLDHEPVTARAPSLGYVLQRWVRRHRAAAAALLALCLGSSLAVWQAVRATRSEQRALTSQRQAEASEAKAVASAQDADAASRMILKSLRDFDPAFSGRAFQREDIQRELLKRVHAYAGDPLRKAAMLMEIAVSLNGEEKVATEKEGVELAASVLPPDSERLWQMRHSKAGTKSNQSAYREEGLAEMQALLKESLARSGPEDHRSVRSAFDVGMTLHLMDRHEEAFPLVEGALREARLHPGRYSASEHMSFRLIMGKIQAAFGRVEEALALGREAVGLAQGERGPQHYETGNVVLAHARICGIAHEQEEAITMARQAMAIFLAAAGPLDPGYKGALDFSLDLLAEKKDTQGALALHEEVAVMHDQKIGVTHPDTIKRHTAWFRALRGAGRDEEARQKVGSWLAQQRQSGQPLPMSCEAPLRMHTRLLLEAAQWPQAEADLRDLLRIMRKKNAKETDYGADMIAFGASLLRQKKNAEALPALEEAASVLKEVPDSSARTFYLQRVQDLLKEVHAALQGPPVQS